MDPTVPNPTCYQLLKVVEVLKPYSTFVQHYKEIVKQKLLKQKIVTLMHLNLSHGSKFEIKDSATTIKCELRSLKFGCVGLQEM